MYFLQITEPNAKEDLERWDSWGRLEKRTHRNEAVGVKKEYGRK